MALRKRVLTFLVKNTVLAPIAVIAQVNTVAIKAWSTGDRVTKVFIIQHILKEEVVNPKINP
jgi:hypothetical protein